MQYRSVVHPKVQASRGWGEYEEFEARIAPSDSGSPGTVMRNLSFIRQQNARLCRVRDRNLNYMIDGTGQTAFDKLALSCVCLCGADVKMVPSRPSGWMGEGG